MGVSIHVARAVRSLRNRIRARTHLARAAVARAFYEGSNLWTCGTNLQLHANVDLEIYGALVLGNNVTLSNGCHLAVGPNAVLEIGDDSFVGRNSVVVASHRVTIGARVLIAEHCSVRDSDHSLDADARRGEIRTGTGATLGSVSVGDDVWIGAGVRLLRGATLGRGAVVAANAVVKGEFEANTLLGGVPARVLRSHVVPTR